MGNSSIEKGPGASRREVAHQSRSTVASRSTAFPQADSRLQFDKRHPGAAQRQAVCLSQQRALLENALPLARVLPYAAETNGRRLWLIRLTIAVAAPSSLDD